MCEYWRDLENHWIQHCPGLVREGAPEGGRDWPEVTQLAQRSLPWMIKARKLTTPESGGLGSRLGLGTLAPHTPRSQGTHYGFHSGRVCAHWHPHPPKHLARCAHSTNTQILVERMKGWTSVTHCCHSENGDHDGGPASPPPRPTQPGQVRHKVERHSSTGHKQKTSAVENVHCLHSKTLKPDWPGSNYASSAYTLP